jgi:hypothetical protein
MVPCEVSAVKLGASSLMRSMSFVSPDIEIIGAWTL